MKPIAKFKCSHTIDMNDNNGETRILLLPVYQGSEENKNFWGGPPSGNIELNICDPETKTYFVPGRSYYVHFVEAL